METQLPQETFGKRIKKFREKKNWTHKQLSDHCNCYEGTISRIERDVQLPSLLLAIALAKAFEVTLDFLIDVCLS